MENYQQASVGPLYIGNGYDPWLRWDGKTSQAVPAGVAAPLTAPTLAGSGSGQIVGDYQAYVRFKDRDGNLSDLSPISATLTAQNATGNITGATNATPIVITTEAAHGMTTGDLVLIAEVGGNTDANGVWSVTALTTTTFELDNSTANAAYTGGGTWASGQDTVTYSDVPVPDDPKVTIKQILRNTQGQEHTYYVDVETMSLATTTFTSTRSDNELAAQEEVPLLDTNLRPLANIHGIPPANKAVAVSFAGRMFYLAERDYNLGTIKVTNGSTTVVGVGTGWLSGKLASRVLHVSGASMPYTIASIDSPTALTLTEAYADASDNFASYAIRSAEGNLKTIVFSAATLPNNEGFPPDSVLATDALALDEDGDQITGGYTSGPYLYATENRHLHRITFGDELPNVGINEAANRGCVNSKSFCFAGDTVALLDEQGIWTYDDNTVRSISDQIADIFRPQNSPYIKPKSPWKVNWRYKKTFHCVFFEPQQTARWYVCLDGSPRPRHALAYNMRLKRWWVEEYPRPITSSAAGRIDGIPVIFLGSDARTVFCLWQSPTDVASSTDAGTRRGTATSSGVQTLSDTRASFDSTAVGAPLEIVDGTGVGQKRRIVAQSATQLTVSVPWTTKPDTTSVYQIGAVHWQFRSRRFQFVPSDTSTKTQIACQFEPTAAAALMRIRVYQDFSAAPTTWRNPIGIDAGAGVRVDKNLPDWTVDLSKELGYIRKKIDRHAVRDLDAPQYMQADLQGATNQDEQVIFALQIDGVG